MIKFSAVSKQFSDDTFGLQDINLDVAPGELVVITGHSGSGKTTLMRLLTKEYVPTAGEIFFDKIPLSSLRSSEVPYHRRQIGVVFQDYKLLPEYNVWENIALPLHILGKDQDEIESRVTDLLRLVGLTDKAFLFPTQLSGGEAQRISIARALATGPAVIFADEPTGNLDPDTTQSIAKLLYKINQLGTTVLLATHDMGVLEALPKFRQVQLEHGRIIHDSQPSRADETEKPDKTEKKDKNPADEDEEKSKKKKATEPQPNEPEAVPTSDKKGPRLKLKLPGFKSVFGKKKAPNQTNEEVPAL